MFNAAFMLQADSQCQRSSTGFSFGNRDRDGKLAQRNGLIPMPPEITRCCVVGVKYRDGIIIATDRKTTNYMKTLYRLQDNIYIGCYGVCGDLHQVARLAAAQMELHRLQMHSSKVPVVCANQFVKHLLYRFHGQIQVNLLVGGVDSGGPSLYFSHFDGTSDKIPFAANGPRQLELAAMAVLEKGWHANLDEKQAEALAIEAVKSGIRNDLFSDSLINVCVIRTDYSVHLYDKNLAVNVVPKQSVLRETLTVPKVLFAMDHPLVPVAKGLHSASQDADKFMAKGSRTALALERHRARNSKEINEIEG
ncbi:proteasome subunit beta type-7-like [Drosophila guanche]|uniref:Blast:Proteasome subunit beta type-7 n=1 Tax=Drosophila guanche TaxID=7266 RepID=A0A3B0K5H9_DROGU|nr:proteasome subunit beta type-7-like [Drosophila guanche]SPP83280.1 blast:Proteasome subunit beta type-7 [Drosophila guanche]